ncbi:ABC transporter substrate-binding protein [Octadecabacter sp. CECT 8868]|uniref:taurine ABC transporter substrate-binding protein n=1 Tax=Octadecabacter algicola TaxID=2909342 RepID=UPI001F3B3F5F|nr:ABC transporter substrate-binding protein [Octadecabacter algicola]MCF2905554.1 ABC transporter substrate-binding protein [Octadecabacter algicola]
MIKKTTGAIILGAVAALSGTTAMADGHSITVGYFLEWPMPFQYAKVQGTYEEALGMEINWVSFDTGTAMSAAMASGDVQLSVSQGVPPFVVATSAGQDLQMLDVAVSYADNDNCVVRSDLEIDGSTAGDLAGSKVAVPLGTAAHYGFLRQMDHFGVDVSSLEVVDMSPPDGAAALAQGSVDMMCGWGGSLRRALESGNTLMTGAEKTELGILVFDVTSGPTGWIAENEETVSKFLAVTAEANAMWNAGDMADEMLPIIAQDAGMDVDATAQTMATFVFPSVEEQLGDAWLGAAAPAFLSGVANVFVDAGSIDGALESYEGAINTGPLASANEM